jgi:hypothetical protein
MRTLDSEEYRRESCCVEACLIDRYLRDSDIYVHESCCLGVQRHLPTYMKRRKRQDGPQTYMQQMWYLISVTRVVVSDCLRYSDNNVKLSTQDRAKRTMIVEVLCQKCALRNSFSR